MTVYLTRPPIACPFDLTVFIQIIDCLSICHIRQLFLSPCLTDSNEFRNAIEFKTYRFSWKVLLHYLRNSSNMTCQLNAKLSNKTNSYTFSENLLFNHEKEEKISFECFPNIHKCKHMITIIIIFYPYILQFKA